MQMQQVWSTQIMTLWFPTCQVRVVRFYVCCPSPLRSFLPLLPRLRRHPRRPLRQMSLDVNMDLQSAVGSAGPQQRAPDCSGQRRTSTGQLWSGLGNAGPHPGSSRAEWAAPDLSCQKICQKICQKRMSEEMSEEMSEDMSEEMSDDMSIETSDNMSEKNVRRNVRRYVKRYVRRYVKRYVRKECQKNVRRNVR